jgi:hypothetical protein
VIEVSDDDDDKVIEILDDDEEVIKILDDDDDNPPGKTSNSRISYISGAMVPGSSIYSSSSKVCLWYL